MVFNQQYFDLNDYYKSCNCFFFFSQRILNILRSYAGCFLLFTFSLSFVRWLALSLCVRFFFFLFVHFLPLCFPSLTCLYFSLLRFSSPTTRHELTHKFVCFSSSVASLLLLRTLSCVCVPGRQIRLVPFILSTFLPVFDVNCLFFCILI